MVFVPINQTCQAEIRCLLNNVEVENTLYFYLGADIELIDLQNLGTKLANWWYNLIRQQQTGQVIHREVYLRDMTTEFSTAWADASRNATTGTQSATATLPANVACLVQFRTGFPGRAFRGRNFVFGAGTMHISSGQFVSGYRSALIGAYQTLMPGGTYDPAPFRWVITSRYEGGVPREHGTHISVSQVTIPSLYPRSQRRRMAQ